MTSGAKFGGDYLAYPGDPLLYHAQFTVRCVRHDAAQHPLALAAATRMAHAARKHVVLASVHPAEEPGGESSVQYVTFAPDIQQSTNRDKKAAFAVWGVGGGEAKAAGVEQQQGQGGAGAKEEGAAEAMEVEAGEEAADAEAAAADAEAVV